MQPGRLMASAELKKDGNTVIKIYDKGKVTKHLYDKKKKCWKKCEGR